MNVYRVNIVRRVETDYTVRAGSRADAEAITRDRFIEDGIVAEVNAVDMDADELDRYDNMGGRVWDEDARKWVTVEVATRANDDPGPVEMTSR